MPTTATERGAPRALRWPLAAVLVLLGLFAMHGLPMQQPTSTATPAAMSMPMTAVATDHVTDAADPDQAAAATEGCGTDGHCVATIHTRTDLPAPALVRVDADAPAPVWATRTHQDTGTDPTGRPPDLDELGISRT